MFGLFMLIFLTLFMMNHAVQDPSATGGVYSALLLINILASILMIVLIIKNILLLYRQLKAKAAGSKLTARLVMIFATLSLVPVVVVYFFSMQILHKGIETWFDVKVEAALQDSLSLSQASLDLRMRELLKTTQEMGEEIRGMTVSAAIIKLDELRESSGASELTLFSSNGRITASSLRDPTVIVPQQPNESLMLNVRNGESYVGLDPDVKGQLNVRAMVNTRLSTIEEGSILHALYPISERISQLANTVEQAYADYNTLSYLKRSLKISFTITLSLVLVLSVLSAVWAAFFYARRLVKPIEDLAEGTKKVALGVFDEELRQAKRDELGFLVDSFNDMMRQLARAQLQSQQSNDQLEQQRAYLQAILGGLSSGVMVVNRDGIIATLNQAAGHLLMVDPLRCLGGSMLRVVEDYPVLAGFGSVVAKHLELADTWKAEAVISRPEGRQLLLCSGRPLPVTASQQGLVIVFEDITNLIQVQRNAAWGEVARRLAHEIKNPLTPIQLSAERMRRKYLTGVSTEEFDLLDRSTHTIVQQVKALKDMVNDFSEYAKNRNVDLEPLDLNSLVREVVELYKGSEQSIQFVLGLAPDLPLVEADSGKIRQLLHNLFKNAKEAMVAVENPQLMLTTRLSKNLSESKVMIDVQDNGSGFSDEVLAQAMEPYVTTKTKGTGLGLAIVKKIVEEHAGQIQISNVAGSGALVTVTLPVQQQIKVTGQMEGANG